jgi:hypothetical protein
MYVNKDKLISKAVLLSALISKAIKWICIPMNELLKLSNNTLLIILESFPDYFIAMRFVLSFRLGFYGSLEHKHLLKIFTEYTQTEYEQSWVVNGKRHREFGLPAIIYSSGDRMWYKNNKRHRDNDLPAIIYSSGFFAWYNNGKKHRDGDLPAIIRSNGNQAWYKNGKQHRDNDLPAVVCSNGYKEWWKNGIKNLFR